MNQHTKELKSNDLASWIETRMVGFGKYVKPVLTLSAILLLATLTVMGIRSQRERAEAKGWADFMMAGGDDAALRNVAKIHQGTEVGLWALATRGANDLQAASSQLHYDREQAREAIDSAITDLEEVVEQTNSKKSTLVRAHALFSLAQAHELKFDVGEAKKYYTQLQTEGASVAPTLAAVGTERAKMIDNVETRQFYTWYATQSAPRPGVSTPPGMVPPVSDADLPSDLTILPDFPDLTVPTAPPLPETPPTPEAPPAPAPSENAPEKGTPESPEKGTPESPEKGTPESPEKGTPEAPAKGTPEAPAKGTPAEGEPEK